MEQITKEQFRRYVAVQYSGVTNMFDATTVTSYSGLQRKTQAAIMEQYGELSKKYPDVLESEEKRRRR